ncbi:MAG: aldo/keto reductase [Pseudomonadota bacterium]
MSPLLTLNDGRTMPQLGLGLMRFGSEAETAEVLTRAAQAGYRLFDSAAVYGNEREVGDGLRQCGVARDELFVTTKLWNAEHGRDKPRAALTGSLERLGLERIDLYLIHWPLPMFDQYVDTWRALIELQAEGLIGSIGVSNFNIEHLERLIDETGVVPAVNQIELHPLFQQRELHAFHVRHGIVSQAWSPFGGGGLGGVPLLADPVLGKIAAKHGCTPSQVVLRWLTQYGASAIPKATGTAHLAQNMASFEFTLDEGDLADVAALDTPDGRSGPDPLTFALKDLSELL